MDLLYHFFIISAIISRKVSELNSKSYLLYGGTLIPNGADMNDYNTPGNYFCSTNVVAQSLLNSPFTQAFIMKVELSTGSAYPSQTFIEYNTRKMATRYRGLGEQGVWQPYVYFSDDATLISSNRIWRTVTVYNKGDFKDCNDIPVNCIGNTYSTALNRPIDSTGQMFAIFCIGSEVDRYKAQYAFPSVNFTNKIQYRFYNYTGQSWSSWESI